jgi:hypothetical protein
MLEIGKSYQAQNITPGHTIQDVWGKRIEVFTMEVATGGATVIFNPDTRPVAVGAESPMKILGYFNLD